MGSHHKDAKLKKVFDPKPLPVDGPYRFAAYRTQEFKPLKRDFFEHMRLCEGTRR